MKMNVETNSLENYISFVDTTTRQKTYFKKFVILFAFVTSLFLFFFFYSNI